MVWYNSSVIHVQQMTDGAGNPYSCAIGLNDGLTVPPVSPAGWQQEIYYGKVVTGGSLTVTATFSGTFVEEKAISAFVFGNANADDPIADTPVANIGVANLNDVITTDSINTSTGRMIFGAAWFLENGAPDIANNFAAISTLKSNVVEDKPISGPGNVNASFISTYNGQQNWIAQLVTLK